MNTSKTIKGLIPLIFFFLFSFSISAYSYNQLGSNNTQFHASQGWFNEQTSQICGNGITCNTKLINNPTFIPLVDDIDNNGVYETLVLDGTSLRIFNDTSLITWTGYTYPYAPDYMYIYDYDGDGFKDIFTTTSRGSTGVSKNYLYSLMFNGTGFNLTNITELPSDSSGDSLVACRGLNDCAVFYTRQYNTGASTGILDSFQFGSDHKTLNVTNLFTTAGAGALCFAQIKSVQVADYDDDGTQEYIVAVNDRFGDSLKILYVSFRNNNLILERTITESDMVDLTSANCDSTGTISDIKFTEPIVFDFDPGRSGLETIIGFQTDVDQFKIYEYGSTGTSEIKQFPSILGISYDVDGRLLSNIAIANTDISEDVSEATDACVLGLNNDGQTINLVCVSAESSRSYDYANYDINLLGLYNVTSNDYKSYHNIIHFANMDSSTSSDELICSYGVFGLVYGNDANLDYFWPNPKGDSAVIPVDIKSIGRTQLLALTATNLWSITDAYETTGCQIDYYYIDPCVDSTWKQNTSIEVRVKGFDAENNKVSIKSILYYGSGFPQDTGYTPNISSGATATFSFIANETIPGSILRLQCVDTSNPGDIDYIDLPFSVGSTGVSKGQCITEKDVKTSEELANETGISANVTGTQLTGEIIGQNMTDLFDVFGWSGIGKGAMWILIMILMTGVLIWNSKDWFSANPILMGIALGLMNIMMVILGVYLHFLSVFFVFLIVFIGAGICVYMLRSVFFSTGG